MRRVFTTFFVLFACNLTVAAAIEPVADIELSSYECDSWNCGQEVVDCGCGACVDDSLFGKLSQAFDLDVLYTADTFSNTNGGLNRGTAYSALLDVVLRTHLDAIGLGAIGGDFVLHGQNKHGPALNRFVGSSQSTNIDAEPFTAMAEYYWERPMADDMVILRAGRQVGAIQFSVLDLAADFAYGGFQKSPNNPIPWYPNPTVAVTGGVRLTESLDLNTGAFNGGDPDQLSPWGWSDRGQVYSVSQLKYRYSVNGLPGDLQTGAWYESGDHTAIGGPGAFDENYGVYTGWDQLVWSEADNPDQGLGTFFIYSWAPFERNAITNHFATGVVYRGLLAQRDSDVVGLGLSIADYSSRLAGFSTEDSVELFYKVNVTDKLIVQPDLRYVSNPGGVNDDTVVAGFRLGVEL
jgi:porin